jgi:hypothetical protein
MYKLDVMSRWNIVKGILKQQYNLLTDEDLVFKYGKEGDIIRRLQKKLNKSRSEIMRMIGEVV